LSFYGHSRKYLSNALKAFKTPEIESQLLIKHELSQG
jgi:hypothetical protein